VNIGENNNLTPALSKGEGVNPLSAKGEERVDGVPIIIGAMPG
jgi:hypothetical protein